MKRTTILAAVLALVLAACGADQPSPTTTQVAATPTVEPTPDATPSPTEEPETPAPTDDGGFTGSLAEALPDEVGGFPRQSMPGFEAFILPALEAQGFDADDAEFALASWGEGQESVIVTAMRMPGVTDAQLELLGRLMGSMQTGDGAGTDVEAETVTVGGKQVLRVTPADTDGEVLIYIVGDAFFTVISESPELAEELLSQLP